MWRDVTQINVRPTDALRVSFVGYKTEVVELKGKTKINIRLNPTAENIEEVTVVAFGEQKKESVVSAITTVDVKQLKSSSSDLTTQFAGKIPGMIRLANGWYSRGDDRGGNEHEILCPRNYFFSNECKYRPINFD